MSDLRIEATRGGLVESVHRVSVAVVDTGGRLAARAGDAGMLTFWRSAAKPFQALPLVADGAADAWGFGAEELALACASHSSEPVHLDLAQRMLERIGCTEADLACGPHTPLSPTVAERVAQQRLAMSPRWSNCSGKHAGMLALARFHGWATSGYERAGHPVQERILDELCRWTGLTRDAIGTGVDGCTAVSFALPLSAMALAYARLGVSDEPAAARIRAAMWEHAHLVAGTGRLCTDLMAAWPRRVLVKVGAAGIYSAALPALRLGIAVKVEDGAGDVLPLALLEVLAQVLERAGCTDREYPRAPLERHAGTTLRNTRGEAIGALRAAGGVRFRDRLSKDMVRQLPSTEV